MNASHTDSDPYALSTQVAADHSAYHVNIDVGPYHIAYADIRPTCSSVELSIDVATGYPSPDYVAASSTRCSTSTSCAQLEPCWPPCPSVTSTYSTTWPNTASTFTRGRLGIAAWLTDASWDNDADIGRWVIPARVYRRSK